MAPGDCGDYTKIEFRTKLTSICIHILFPAYKGSTSLLLQLEKIYERLQDAI